VPPFHVLLLSGSLQCFRQVCMCVRAGTEGASVCCLCDIRPVFLFWCRPSLYNELLSTGAATY
jgi:hypothetical protein